MADLIEYRIQVDGARQGVSALESVRERYEASRKSVTLFDAEVHRAADRFARQHVRKMAEASVRVKLGIDDNARSATSLRASLDRLAVATTKQAAATQTAVAASTTWARSAQQLTPAFSALGASISSLTPELGAYANAVGRAGGAMSGATAIIGGAGGLVAGTLIAGLGALATHVLSVRREQEELARATRDATRAMEAQERVSSATAFFEARFQSGPQLGGSVESLRAQQLAIRAQLESARRPGGAQLSSAAIASLREQLRSIESAIAASSFLRPGVTLGDLPGGSAAPRGGTVAAAARSRRGDSLAEQIRRGEEENRRLRDELAARARPTLQDESSAELDRFAREQRRALALRPDDTAARATIAGAVPPEQVRELASLREEFAALEDVGVSAFQSIGAAGLSVFQALARGEKDALGQSLYRIGTELGAKGIAWFLEGLVLTAIGHPAGPVYLGAGTVAQTIAAGFGAALPHPSGGGGGGGGARAATPIAPSAGASAGASESIHIHVNMLQPSKEAGEMIVRSIDEAKRRGRA